MITRNLNKTMSYQFPDHLYYEKEHHVWCSVESNQCIRVGIDQLGLASLGDLAYLSLNPHGSEILQGQPMGVLEAAKMTGELIAPASGIILEHNQSVLEDPYLVNQDPYGNGWLVVLEGKNWTQDSVKLITGSEVESWSKVELERYRQQGWID
jgi:glycine cleavage system H protein